MPSGGGGGGGDILTTPPTEIITHLLGGVEGHAHLSLVRAVVEVAVERRQPRGDLARLRLLEGVLQQEPERLAPIGGDVPRTQGGNRPL